MMIISLEKRQESEEDEEDSSDAELDYDNEEDEGDASFSHAAFFHEMERSQDVGMSSLSWALEFPASLQAFNLIGS